MGDHAIREGDYVDADPDVEDSHAVAAGDEETRACSQRDESNHPSDSDGSVNSSDNRGILCPRAQDAVSKVVRKQDAILSVHKNPVGANPGFPPNASAADDLNSSSAHCPTVLAERVCQDGGVSGLREEEEEAERRELMQYAEVLYKCALCTTLPCILTSEASFLAHVREQHLNVPHEPKCRHCRLHFATAFDLAEHAARVHQEISEDNCDSDDTCDSISREEPGVVAEETDRFSPKQLKQSSDPEDSDGDGRTPTPSRSETKTPTNDSLYRLQKLAEQILQSQVSRREALSGFAVQAVSAASFHASFTPEFGRYTKLVREGGNIVYFCQVCNVKCQVKAAFHVHCNGIHHHNKVRLADKNSKDGAASDGPFSASPSKTSPPVRAKEGHVTPNQAVPRATLLKVPLVPHSSERLTSDSTSTFRLDSVKVGRSTVESAVGQAASTTTANGKVDHEEPRLAAATVRDSPVCQVNVVRSLTETSDSDLSTDDKSALSFDHWSRAHSNLGHRKRRKSQAPKAVRARTCASPGCLPSGEVSVDTVTGVAVGSDKENSENCSPKGVTLASSPNGTRELSPALNHRVTGVSDESRDLQKYVKLEHVEESCFPSENSKSFERGQPVYSSSDEEMAELKSEAGQLGTRKRKLFEDEAESVEEAEANEGHAQSTRAIYPCPLCGFHADDPQLQEKHYLLVHNMNIGSEVTLVDGLGGHNNEGWKVMKIRELLPGLIEESPRGSVSRDLLLQRISMLLDHPHAVTWGPACNRAVREEHPHSVAQRKGKFKKTYFFGVSLIQRRGEEEEEEDVEEFEGLTARPLRDMTQDLEQILENLPCLLRWTGHVQKGVSRDEVLRALAEHVGEAEVQHWGVQCNRAVRMLFPHVEMKRKGKYKTVYFGVGFTSDKQSSEKVVDTAATSPASNKPERSWFSSSGITQIPSHAWAAYLLSFGHKLH